FVGTVQTSFQHVLSQVNQVTQLINDVADTGRFVLDSALSTISLATGSIDAAFDAVARFAPANVATELNEFLLEARVLILGMGAHFVDTFGPQAPSRISRAEKSFSTARHLKGSTTDILTDKGAPLRANPFLGFSTLNAVTDIDGLLQN